MIYTYECPGGHVTELEFRFGANPKQVACPDIPDEIAAGDFPLYTKSCERPATQVITGGGGYIVNKVMDAPSKRKGAYLRDL